MVQVTPHIVRNCICVSKLAGNELQSIKNLLKNFRTKCATNCPAKGPCCLVNVICAAAEILVMTFDPGHLEVK